MSRSIFGQTRAFIMRVLLSCVVVLALLAAAKVEAAATTPAEDPFDRVVRLALEVVDAEEGRLQQRLDNGVDKTVPTFTEVEPGILEGVARPLDDLAEEIGGPSRILNWIRIIALDENVAAPVKRILRDSPLAQQNGLKCPYKEPKDCSLNEKYRRVDGSCNNIDNPLWGAALTPMGRDLPAEFDSGPVRGYTRDDLPRQTGKNGPLPSARLVSNVVHAASTTQLENPLATMAFVFFGQMTAHDVTDTSFERGADNAFLDCCTPNNLMLRRCASIEIPSGDFFEGFGRTCLGLPRAKEVTDLSCTGNHEQLNFMSSFVDSGNVYGQTEEILQGLRGEEGKMELSEPNHLPFTQHPNVHAFQKGFNFMDGGDERVSEVIGLTGITTILHREHNRVAEALAQFQRFSSITDDEERSDAIFEEARKISIAVKQHITYNEFLRLALGDAAMTKYNLKPETTGYFTGYNSSVDPTMTNEVIVSAQRFGHSVLRGILSVLKEDFSPADNVDSDELQLRKIFFRPNFYLLFENGFQRGVMTDSAEVCDRHIDDEIREHLFETEDGNGEDLIARNIQRARDHGVSSYNAVRNNLGLSTATNFTTGNNGGFEDLAAEVVSKLSEVYDDPDDVDLFTGGISETPVADGVVGPLFSELLGRQFERLRYGDRYWYERQEHGFTEDQLNSIRTVTIARLMCDNVDGVTSIQPEAFKLATISGNARDDCDNIAALDLSLWENE